MTGVLFVISIPTKAEEKRLSKISRGFHHERTSTIDQSEVQTPNTADVEYGTFSKYLESGGDGQPEDDGNLDKPKLPKLLTLRTLTPPTRQSRPLIRTGSCEFVDEAPELTPLTKSTPTIKKSWEGLKEVVIGSAKRVKTSPVEIETKSLPKFLDISDDSPMEQIITEMLKKMKIENATWQISHSENYAQIVFSIKTGLLHEKVLAILSEWGIGERDGSSVSVIPLAVYNRPHLATEEDHLDANEDLLLAQKQTAWDRFMNSVRARLNVAKIVQEVKQNASITFDSVVLLVCAGILAATGLVEDSVVCLASSMLISPLMGPIIATIFGIVIKDRSLTRFGLFNELLGLFLATSIGFCFGLIYCSIDERFAYGSGELTFELKSRCDLHSLLIGVVTALPSGAAVAIAILGENIGSLVGVAISASLLPPAVNAGVLWSLSLLHLCYGQNEHRFNNVVRTNIYSDNQAVELAVYGAISMLLTIVNIICILAMGVLVLKIKEVAPIQSVNQRQFWKHDLKMARDYSKTCHSREDVLTSTLVNEIAEFQGNDTDLKAELLRNIGRPSYQNTWSPMDSRVTGHGYRDARPSIHDFETMFMNLGQPKLTGLGVSNNPSMSLLTSVDSLIRRASIAYVPTVGRPLNLPTFKAGHLDRITESNTSSTDVSHEPNLFHLEGTPRGSPKAKTRKFVVTPAYDPLIPKDD